MDQQDANARVTGQPTPEGQNITTEMVFDLFASLVPDSPWAIRLRKIKTVFNHLASGAHMLTTVPGWSLADQVYDVREREGQGWNGEAVAQFSKGVAELCAGLQLMGIEVISQADLAIHQGIPADLDDMLATIGAQVHQDQSSEGNPDPAPSITMSSTQLILLLQEYARRSQSESKP